MTKKILKIISWNVNGLRAINKKGFSKWLIKESPDILCVQEIKANEEQLPTKLRNIEGYKSYFASSCRKGLDGVGVYTKIEPESVQAGLGIKRFDKEGRVQIVDYADFVLFNVYFPNGKASNQRLKYKMDFYNAFLKYVDKVKNKGRNIIICGDVNTAHKEIDLARPGPNSGISGFLPKERAWIDKFIDRGYVDTFRMFDQQGENYTYWDYKSRARERNVGWRIDYFFVNKKFKKNVKDSCILPNVMGSDHCPIGLEVTI